MPNVIIESRGCRGCTMCADICPTDVFDYDSDAELAQVARTEDCIGCLSCFYICPSQCIQVEDVHQQRPFYRLEGNVALVEKLLQEKTATSTLTEQDWEEARQDVASTLVALSNAIVEMIGRANQVMGRKAGTLSAAHLPEIYEAEGLDQVLEGLQGRFRHCFDFEAKLGDAADNGQAMDLTFAPCSLLQVVKDAGQEPGEAITCKLFHAYFAGLVGAYVGKNYTFKVDQAGPVCKLHFEPR